MARQNPLDSYLMHTDSIEHNGEMKEAFGFSYFRLPAKYQNSTAVSHALTQALFGVGTKDDTRMIAELLAGFCEKNKVPAYLPYNENQDPISIKIANLDFLFFRKEGTIMPLKQLTDVELEGFKNFVDRVFGSELFKFIEQNYQTIDAGGKEYLVPRQIDDLYYQTEVYIPNLNSNSEFAIGVEKIGTLFYKTTSRSTKNEISNATDSYVIVNFPGITRSADIRDWFFTEVIKKLQPELQIQEVEGTLLANDQSFFEADGYLIDFERKRILLKPNSLSEAEGLKQHWESTLKTIRDEIYSENKNNSILFQLKKEGEEAGYGDIDLINEKLYKAAIEAGNIPVSNPSYTINALSNVDSNSAPLVALKKPIRVNIMAELTTFRPAKEYVGSEPELNVAGDLFPTSIGLAKVNKQSAGRLEQLYAKIATLSPEQLNSNYISAFEQSGLRNHRDGESRAPEIKRNFEGKIPQVVKDAIRKFAPYDSPIRFSTDGDQTIIGEVKDDETGISYAFIQTSKGDGDIKATFCMEIDSEKGIGLAQLISWFTTYEMARIVALYNNQEIQVPYEQEIQVTESVLWMREQINKQKQQIKTEINGMSNDEILNHLNENYRWFCSSECLAANGVKGALPEYLSLSQLYIGAVVLKETIEDEIGISYPLVAYNGLEPQNLDKCIVSCGIAVNYGAQRYAEKNSNHLREVLNSTFYYRDIAQIFSNLTTSWSGLTGRNETRGFTLLEEVAIYSLYIVPDDEKYSATKAQILKALELGYRFTDKVDFMKTTLAVLLIPEKENFDGLINRVTDSLTPKKRGWLDNINPANIFKKEKSETPQQTLEKVFAFIANYSPKNENSEGFYNSLSKLLKYVKSQDVSNNKALALLQTNIESTMQAIEPNLTNSPDKFSSTGAIPEAAEGPRVGLLSAKLTNSLPFIEKNASVQITGTNPDTKQIKGDIR